MTKSSMKTCHPEPRHPQARARAWRGEGSPCIYTGVHTWRFFTPLRFVQNDSSLIPGLVIAQVHLHLLIVIETASHLVQSVPGSPPWGYARHRDR